MCKGGGILHRVVCLIGMQIGNNDYLKNTSALTLFGCEITFQACNVGLNNLFSLSLHRTFVFLLPAPPHMSPNLSLGIISIQDHTLEHNSCQESELFDLSVLFDHPGIIPA